jgi:hypothetical protein
MDVNGAVTVVCRYVRLVEKLGQLSALRVVLSSRVPHTVRASPELTEVCTRAARGGATLTTIERAHDLPSEQGPVRFEVDLIEGARNDVTYDGLRLTAVFTEVASPVEKPASVQEREASAIIATAPHAELATGREWLQDDTTFWQVICALVALLGVCVVAALLIRSSGARAHSALSALPPPIHPGYAVAGYHHPVAPPIYAGGRPGDAGGVAPAYPYPFPTPDSPYAAHDPDYLSAYRRPMQPGPR